jgi:hypothetical protein
MGNSATTKAAREVEVAAQEELARRTRANVEDLAAYFPIGAHQIGQRRDPAAACEVASDPTVGGFSARGDKDGRVDEVFGCAELSRPAVAVLAPSRTLDVFVLKLSGAQLGPENPDLSADSTATSDRGARRRRMADREDLGIKRCGGFEASAA